MQVGGRASTAEGSCLPRSSPGRQQLGMFYVWPLSGESVPCLVFSFPLYFSGPRLIRPAPGAFTFLQSALLPGADYRPEVSPRSPLQASAAALGCAGQGAGFCKSWQATWVPSGGQTPFLEILYCHLLARHCNKHTKTVEPGAKATCGVMPGLMACLSPPPSLLFFLQGPLWEQDHRPPPRGVRRPVHPPAPVRACLWVSVKGEGGTHGGSSIPLAHLPMPPWGMDSFEARSKGGRQGWKGWQATGSAELRAGDRPLGSGAVWGVWQGTCTLASFHLYKVGACRP